MPEPVDRVRTLRVARGRATSAKVLQPRLQRSLLVVALVLATGAAVIGQSLSSIRADAAAPPSAQSPNLMSAAVALHRPVSGPPPSVKRLPKTGVFASAGHPVSAHKPAKVIRELVNQRTSDSQTFVMAGGGRQIRLFSQPHFYQPSGSSSWVPISTSLSVEDGHPGIFTSDQNAWSTTFAPSGAGSGMIQLGLSSGSIQMSADSSSRVTPTRPTGSTAGVSGTSGSSTAEYPQLWPDVNAYYQNEPQGLGEKLILEGHNAQASFSFEVRGAEVIPAQGGGATIHIGSRTVGQIPAPTVTDKDDQVRNADPTLSVSNNGPTSVVTVSVSQSWLSALPSSAFPVVIDPPVTFNLNGPFVYSVDENNNVLQNTVQVGEDPTGDIWRAGVSWDYADTPYWAQSPPYQVTDAYTTLIDEPGSCGYDPNTGEDDW